MITLHHCPQTRSMRSLWLLNELGVDFEVVTYPFDKTLGSPAFLARSPAGRVPAVEIGDQTLFETGAITEYLCEAFPQVGLGRRPDDPERAAWLSWVHFAETVSVHVAALTQQHIVLYDDAMRSPTVMKLEAARLAKCYKALDHVLDGQPYLLPSAFSAADIGIGQAIYMGRFFVRLDEYRGLSSWYDRLSERPGFRAALPKAGETELYSQEFYPPWDDARG
ncbi:MAG: glutathione S-transferase family protein [Marinovum sp.]|nr:glutathione S-transferase family protein [Marinovum sp.]